MLTKAEIRDYVDEYAVLAAEAEGIKARQEYLKGQFETLALERLKDTKLQSVEYWGSGHSRVTVTTSATVKPLSVNMLRQVLGDMGDDIIRTKPPAPELTEPGKRFLASVVQGNYLEGTTLDGMIAAITSDEQKQATLRKKLKGKYDKDKAVLMAVAELDEAQASEAAYLATEVLNWERLLQILQAANWPGTPQEAIALIKAAVIVEDGIKVTVAAEPPEM